MTDPKPISEDQANELIRNSKSSNLANLSAGEHRVLKSALSTPDVIKSLVKLDKAEREADKVSDRLNEKLGGGSATLKPNYNKNTQELVSITIEADGVSSTIKAPNKEFVAYKAASDQKTAALRELEGKILGAAPEDLGMREIRGARRLLQSMLNVGDLDKFLPEKDHKGAALDKVSSTNEAKSRSDRQTPEQYAMTMPKLNGTEPVKFEDPQRPTVLGGGQPLSRA